MQDPLPSNPVRLKKPIVLLLLCSVAALLLFWMYAAPAGLLGKADAVGYAVCHRIDGRSFHLGERALPLCARCTGMYLGAALGLVYQALRSPHRGGFPPRRVWAVWAFFLAAFGIDGVNSYLHLFPLPLGVYEPQNWLRLVTGTGMGLALAGVVFPAFNQTAWLDWSPQPAIPGLRSMAVLALLALGVDGLVLTENPLLLYPLALVSAATVLVVLTMVYSLVWLMLLRRENVSLRLAQLAFPLAAGFGLALLQIALLDLVRYWLTGTWDGFHLG
ncbi:MAG: DUF2085 domain-containing protein [Chloroflexota bacterium]